jgi:Fe-S cluster assembly protein SufD
VTPLPTRKQETWRYADLKALAQAQTRARTADQSDEIILTAARHALIQDVDDGAQLHSHVKIIVPTGKNVTLIERWKGHGWLNRKLDIAIAPGAQLEHIILQQLDVGSETTAEINVQGSYRGFILNMGSEYGRISLNANASDTQLAAVQLGQGDQTLEIITRFNHEAARTRSTQLVRSVMAQRATGSYLGKIFVADAAQGTDAVQSSKALLLHRTATVNTKPELEIYADDVKCAHGATVGELDKKALFYCQTRGIPMAEARALLTTAFVADAVEKIQDDETRTQVEMLCANWLAQAVCNA